MEESYLSQLDPRLLQTGEAVARLAVQLAKAEAKHYSQALDVEGALPEAWKLLRRACLEIDTTGKKRTLDDYKRFWIAPPKELVEASKPPPPEPLRVSFDRLFTTASELALVPLDGPNESGSPDTFEWKQYSLGTGTGAEVRKAEGYKTALAMVDERIRRRLDELAKRRSLVDNLCHGCQGNWTWPFFDQNPHNGDFTPVATDLEMSTYEAAVQSIPRPNCASVSWKWRPTFSGTDFKSDHVLAIHERVHSELPGPPPSEASSAEELYASLKNWAEQVLESWKQKLVEIAFAEFWQTGKEKGFLWDDVRDMALQTKKHKGGIKWRSGFRIEAKPEESEGKTN